MSRPRNCRAVKKTKGNLARYVRLWIIGLSISGTRAYLFRAIRYSVFEFFRGFSLLFSALLIVPKMIGNGVICAKNTVVKTLNRETWIRAEWTNPGSWAITTTIRDAVAGVPSLFRSLFASVQAQFYGVAHSFYHSLEALKSLYNVHAGYFQQFGEAVAHAFFAVKAFVFGTFSALAISVSHFFEYIAGLWETFRTGTSQTMSRLWEKEQTWKTQVFSRFDDGRDYISKKVTQIFEFFSSGFHQCGQAVRNFQAKSTDMFMTAKDYWRNMAVKVRTSVGGAVDEAEEKIVVNAKGIVVTIRAGYENLVNRLKNVNVKDSMVIVRARVENLIKGFKISNIRAKFSEANETIVIYMRGSFEKSKDLMHSWKSSIASNAAEGKRLLILHISAAGRSTGHFLWRLSRPIVTPVTYVVSLPSRTFRTVTTTPCWRYLYIVGLLAAVGYLTYLIKLRHKNENYARKLKTPKKVRDGCQELNLPDSVLRQCMDKLRAQIDLGLNPDTRDKSTVKCFNTYVQDLPTGKEKGQFLALDLGGTNFRVLLITLNGRHFDMQSKIYVVPKAIMIGPGEDLFDHIASCLESFTLEHRVANKNLPLGFTFSFPLNQVGLKNGILTRWTKGFNCAGTVGRDVVEMLNAAVEKRKNTLKIDVVAVLNDTTGTLMSCAWKNHNCKVGVILGTGSNACYVEKIQNVIGFDGDKTKPYVIINTEWGAFGDNGELEFIRTPYDKEIDKNSVNPGKQLHEKMISGMYLGELARLLIVKFVKDKILFGGQASPALLEREKFLTEYISSIESDPRGVFKQCRNVLSKIGISDPTDQDCSNVRYICESVSRRAAHLASAGVATLLNKMEIPSVTVGVDGSLYRYHPHFHNLMYEKIPELLDPRIENPTINLMLSEDGSGRGAALIAASGSEHNV